MMVAEVAGVNNDLGNRLRSLPSYDEIAEALNVKGFERRSPYIGSKSHDTPDV
jgi:hypothetical protein